MFIDTHCIKCGERMKEVRLRDYGLQFWCEKHGVTHPDDIAKIRKHREFMKMNPDDRRWLMGARGQAKESWVEFEPVIPPPPRDYESHHAPRYYHEP